MAQGQFRRFYEYMKGRHVALAIIGALLAIGFLTYGLNYLNSVPFPWN